MCYTSLTFLGFVRLHLMIFSSEIVCEAFGELVIQSILLFRFQWLVTKDDFSSFGLSFQIYVACVMSISFFTMVCTILKYHNRNRNNLRKTFSLYTATLVIVWIILLVLKVAVYVFGFMNNPGLFWVPMFVKMCLISLLFCKCNFFSSLPAHDKFVFAMASSLVPVSVPSKETKGTKALYAVSFVLFLVECLSVLLFAYLIRHFYHFEAYREFYGLVLTEKVHAESFDILFLYMVAAVVAVISVAIMLLAISNYCCHPKSTLFPIVSPKPGSNPAETGDEEDQDEEGQ